MTRPWQAEREVSVALAAQLIAAQFPELAGGRVEEFGAGWDNTAFLVGGGIVFRFPRKQAAVASIETEARVLPRLARQLPLRIPVPEWVGRPVEGFPWPFIGHRLVAGELADRARLSDVERAGMARVLAEFVARLHAVSCDGLSLPGDVLERTDIEKRMPQIVERLDALRARGLIRESAPWLELFEEVRPADTPRPRCVVHGDLYARHLVVDADRRLNGVIDWGDMHEGDPAVDLTGLYAFLPRNARSAFLEVYGPVDDATLAIARLRAAFHSISETWYGVEQNDADMIREGRIGMDFVLDERGITA